MIRRGRLSWRLGVVRDVRRGPVLADGLRGVEGGRDRTAAIHGRVVKEIPL
jgi:hypothetical protein